MVAFGHTTAFLLGAAFLVSCTVAAPATAAEGDLAQTQALDYPNEAGASRCYYNFQHYEEGDRIVTNEPCLNCTCHKRMLMCYLRVCPFTKAVGQDCTVEKRPDQCCPVITCPQVPVDILTSSTTTEASASTAVGHPNTYGCTLEDNTFYPDGVQMPSDTKTPCELCYCIRNHTACVRQECTLNVEGCRPIYQEGVCCPVRYDCEYNELTTTERPSTGGLLLSSTASPLQCQYGETLYNDGELIASDKPCESCYCMRGDIVCAVRSCGEPMAGKDCEAQPPPEGECCPTVYQCANETIPVDAITTQSDIIMHSSDMQTESPPKGSEPELSIDEATKTDDPVSISEVTTGPPKEEVKEQENVENDNPEVEEQDTVPEHAESDPLDDVEEDEIVGGIIPVDDAKPDNTNVATESPADHTSAPIKEMEKETDSQYATETATTGPVGVEHEGETESHSNPPIELSEPIQVSSDPEQTPEINVDPEHIQTEQEVGTTAASELDNVGYQAPTQSVSASDSENNVEQPEAHPLDTDTNVSHDVAGIVPDSEPEASDNTEAKPVEGASDNGVSQQITSEHELKPQEEIPNISVDESVQEETAPNVPELPESLDQKKDEDFSTPTNDIVPASDSVSDEQVDTEVKPTSSESSNPTHPESVEASEETNPPSLEVENEGIQKEPVPPRKEDAIPEEPHPTQHAEGSMTKAEDSIPTDHAETEGQDNAEGIVSTHGNQSPSEADIKPTESLQSDIQTPIKGEEEVQSTLPEVPAENNVSTQETPESPILGDEIESESSTDKVEEPNHPTKLDESTSFEEETVPNVVVTESEVEPSAENSSESSSQDEAEANVMHNSEGEAIQEESSPAETESPVTENKPEDNLVPAESPEGEKHTDETSEKHDDESKDPETPNVSNDETIVTLDNESSTNENEIVEIPQDNSVPVKAQEPSTIEELSASTEKVVPAESEQDQTEINEIIPENSDTQPEEIDPVKESHTEITPSEESSTDTLIKLGNEGKPEEIVNEAETSGSVDSEPIESHTSESENVPHHDNPELNVFQDDLHDPVELDPTDFDEQLEDSDHHSHNEVPSENEIVDDHQPGHGGALDHKHPVHLPGPIGVIPGEGDCLVDGKTYTNNSEIPSRSPCHKQCTCMSSIVHCQGIDCPPPPPQLANCMPVHQGDLCCPVYTCDGNTPESPETDNQVVASDKTPEPVMSEENPVPSGNSEVATEQPHEESSEQLNEVASEKPQEVSSEQVPISETETETQYTTEESPEQIVEESNKHPEEISEPETIDEISTEQKPTTAEVESSTNAAESSELGTEESHKEGDEPESTDDKDPQVVESEEQKPAEENVEPEVQPTTPQDSDVVSDETHETKPESENNAVVSEGSVESQSPILTDAGESQEAELEQSLATDPPNIQEKVPSNPESEEIASEVEEDSNAEDGGENVIFTTERPADPAAEVVDQSSTEVGEDKINITEPPIAKPTGIDFAASVYEHVPLTENISEDVKLPVEEPVKETVESDDISSQSSVEAHETSNEEVALDNGSTVEEADHEVAAPDIESHTEGSTLNEENIPKQPEESVVTVTDLSVEGNSSSESGDSETNLLDKPSEGANPSSNDDVQEHETATVIQDLAETNVPEVSNESVKAPAAEVASIETENESPSVTENVKEIEETETSQPSALGDDKHHDESSVLEDGGEAVTDVYQEGEISEPSTEASHEIEEAEAVPSEEPQQEGSETVQEGEHETSGTAISDSGLTQTVAPVGSEVDASEEPSSEVHSVSSVESENAPASEIPSSEAQLNASLPESSEEQVTTLVYMEQEKPAESGETLSEPTDEQQESSPEEITDPITPLVENQEHSPQPIVLENEGNVEPEVTEHTLTDTSNPSEESDHLLEPTLDSSHQPEQEHEVVQPSVDVTPEQEIVSDTEGTVVPEKVSEEIIKPEQEVHSSEGEEHIEETSEPAHEDIKPELEEDHKEPISQSEVQSGSEEIIHHEEEHSTQSAVEPQRPEDHSQENIVQESEHPAHEVELPESILPHLPTEGDVDSKPSLPIDPEIPTEDQFPTGAGDMDYDVNEDGAFGPGTCRYGGKVYVSAQQIPRDDPCDFCFCFRSDIICLQQSCPPPIHRCHQEPIQGYCCPRYQCPVSMATSLNLTTTTTTTTTTLPPHFFAHAYQGAARQAGCLHRGRAYNVGDEITSESGPCLHCICGSDGEMKCDPVVCNPEPMLRKMMEAAASHRRR